MEALSQTNYVSKYGRVAPMLGAMTNQPHISGTPKTQVQPSSHLVSKHDW
jgi:hypothetical protein